MKSRFDQDKYWYTQEHSMLLSEMSTAHLYNTYVMFARHPERILPMLLQDFDTPERYNAAIHWQAWDAQESIDNAAVLSARAASSMSQTELIRYVYTSIFGRALSKELENRGVSLEATDKDLNINKGE